MIKTMLAAPRSPIQSIIGVTSPVLGFVLVFTACTEVFLTVFTAGFAEFTVFTEDVGEGVISLSYVFTKWISLFFPSLLLSVYVATEASRPPSSLFITVILK